MNKYVALSIVVILLALGVYLSFFQEVSAPQDTTPTSGQNDQRGMLVGNNAIALDDQARGGSVIVAKVTSENEGWVVVHDEREGKPGIIIAARRVNAGTSENVVVDLLGYQTVESKAYFAMLHSDDGDRAFDYTKDLPIRDSLDNTIIMKFIATVTTENKKNGGGVVAQKSCIVGGCNGELCLEESQKEVFTICIFKEEFACYKQTQCERQTDGKCGWTSTPELAACLTNARQKEPSQ